MKHKIIFLDLDGVLIYLNKINKNIIDKNRFPYEIEISQKAILALKSILEKSNAKIVISSTWSKTFSLESIILLLNSYGINGPYLLPEDLNMNSKFKGNRLDWVNKLSNLEFSRCITTPKRLTSKKSHEIKFWLDEYNEFVDSILILDDNDIYNSENYLSEYQYKVNPEKCLLEEDVDKCLNILNKKFNYK